VKDIWPGAGRCRFTHDCAFRRDAPRGHRATRRACRSRRTSDPRLTTRRTIQHRSAGPDAAERLLIVNLGPELNRASFAEPLLESRFVSRSPKSNLQRVKVHSSAGASRPPRDTKSRTLGNCVRNSRRPRRTGKAATARALTVIVVRDSHPSPRFDPCQTLPQCGQQRCFLSTFDDAATGLPVL
jgi:hypothetical protein